MGRSTGIGAERAPGCGKECGNGRGNGRGLVGLRRVLLAICLAAAALAGDDRPAGASQLFKAGGFAPGLRSEASRPQKLRALPDSLPGGTASVERSGAGRAGPLSAAGAA